MGPSGACSYPKRLNILTLDGGGIRGLSSLLILRDLMVRINECIKASRQIGDQHQDVEPHDIFDLIPGTSTGGLIAIMLGKLGMSLEDCIEAYHEISKDIFSKRHFRGRLTGGLAPSKFSGSRMHKCVCKLLLKRGHPEDLRMDQIADIGVGLGQDRINCAVVCREHENESRYSPLKREAVRICSLPSCPKLLACRVSEAARATSAAPTYFPAQKINGSSYIDGGLEYNNPSETIWRHYTEETRRAATQKSSTATEKVHVLSHGTLDFSKVRFVNLGTGTQPDKPQLHQPGIFVKLIPVYHYLGFLKRELKRIATDAELVASHMSSMAEVSDIMFERFSADNGICYIALHKFKKLEKIELLTREYLDSSKVQQDLMRVAQHIAKDYLGTRYSTTTPDLPVDFGKRQGASQLTVSSGLQLNQDNSRNLTTPRDSDITNSTESEGSVEAIRPDRIPVSVIPPRHSRDVTRPADSMIITANIAGAIAPVGA